MGPILVHLLAALIVAGRVSPAPPVGADSTSESALARRLVFASLYGLHWSVLSGVPSGEVSVFLGSSVRPRRRARGGVWRTAIGYEGAVSAGGADYYTAFFSFGGDHGPVVHRHHLTAMGHGGPHGRLFYAFGGGLMLWRSTPIALEADVRLGCMLGLHRATRVKGIVGGQARIVGVLDGIPLPQFGIFAGLVLF